MTDHSLDLLERFRTAYGKDIDLTLRPAYRDLLTKLGNPQDHLPPVFHVAGTNGKGSTCAFLRAILEAAGYRVHVYTSPHLVRFHERIRIAGDLISEDELSAILTECEALAAPGGVSYFEAATAAAFVAFARHAADFTILETGLGGRLDATNVVTQPLATLITRLSFDHREFLGDSIEAIAREKAGIMRRHVPCFAAQQPDPKAEDALRAAAKALGTDLYLGGQDWYIEKTSHGHYFRNVQGRFAVPEPALLGAHQYLNAGLAIAALSALPHPPTPDVVAQGLRNASWPARLQPLISGSLASLLPPEVELWLDGGHNDSAGEVLATQIQAWHAQDAKPLYIILGMLTTKRPEEFLKPFASFVAEARSVPIANEPLGFAADVLNDEVKKIGIACKPSIDALHAIEEFAALKTPARILICGSLYLAGNVLAL